MSISGRLITHNNTKIGGTGPPLTPHGQTVQFNVNMGWQIRISWARKISLATENTLRKI
jgi:hypothetical protein